MRSSGYDRPPAHNDVFEELRIVRGCAGGAHVLQHVHPGLECVSNRLRTVDMRVHSNVIPVRCLHDGLVMRSVQAGPGLDDVHARLGQILGGLPGLLGRFESRSETRPEK